MQELLIEERLLVCSFFRPDNTRMNDDWMGVSLGGTEAHMVLPPPSTFGDTMAAWQIRWQATILEHHALDLL